MFHFTSELILNKYLRTINLKDHHIIGLLWAPNHWSSGGSPRSPANSIYPRPKLYPSLHLNYSTKAFLIPTLPTVIRFSFCLSSASWLGPGNVPPVISKYPSMEGQPASSSLPGTNCAFSLFVCHAAPGWHSQCSKTVCWLNGKKENSQWLLGLTFKGSVETLEAHRVPFPQRPDWVLCHLWKGSAWRGMILNCLHCFFDWLPFYHNTTHTVVICFYLLSCLSLATICRETHNVIYVIVYHKGWN